MKNKTLTAIMTAILSVLLTGCQPITGNRAATHQPDAPGGFYGTNVVLGWKPVPGPVVGYRLQHEFWNPNTHRFNSTGLTLNSNATFFVSPDAFNQNVTGLENYTLAAEFSDGSMSATDTWYLSWHDDSNRDGPPFGPPLVGDIQAVPDATGTNVVITWQPAPDSATNYMIMRGAYNSTNTDGYDFSLIGLAGSNTFSFTAVGAIASTNDLKDVYEVAAIYPGNALSAFVASCVGTNQESRDGQDGSIVQSPDAPAGFGGGKDTRISP